MMSLTIICTFQSCRAKRGEEERNIVKNDNSAQVLVVLTIKEMSRFVASLVDNLGNPLSNEHL